MKNKINWEAALILLLICTLVFMGTKWSEYGTLSVGTIADGDAFLVLDISDTTLGAGGTQKQYAFETLKDDMNNFSVFGFPYDSDPTVDANAEAAVDTTDNQFLIYMNALRVFTYKHRECFALEDPAAADDNVPIFSREDGFTITDMRCWTEGGTNVVMFLSDGTNALDSMTCIATGTDDDGSIANSTFTANEQMEFDITSVSGEVDWVNYCFTYVISRE